MAIRAPDGANKSVRLSARYCCEWSAIVLAKFKGCTQNGLQYLIFLLRCIAFKIYISLAYSCWCTIRNISKLWNKCNILFDKYSLPLNDNVKFAFSSGLDTNTAYSNFTFVSSVRSSNSHPDLLLIHPTTHPLFQITPVLNTGLSLSEPLQLYKGHKAI